MSFKIIIESAENYDETRRKVAANPDMQATKQNPEDEVGVPIIFDIILDISGSMSEFYNELVDCFNNIMIPSLKEASKRYKGGMRLGCLLFSNELIPAWYGFKPLKDMDPKPLKREMLNQPGLRDQTALYGAMRAGILWTAAAMEHMNKTGEGEFPKGKIIVLTDGANNRPPENESAVTNAFESIGTLNRRNLQSVIGFFNTNEGLSESAFNALVSNTGFQGSGFYKIAKGKTLEEKRSNFRHHFDIWSKYVAQMINPLR